MKNLLWLLLLFTGMVNAQPPAITNPQNPTVFDFGNDNYETFEVYSLAPEILGLLNPADYDVKFYNDADFQSYIPDGSGLFTYYINNQTTYVKVTENANPNNFATTSFNILLIPTPVIGQYQNIFQMDIPFDGFGVFDLTTQSASVLNGLTDVTLKYYPTTEDATASTNEITNPSAYTNVTNPQYLSIKVTNNVTGAYSLASLMIVLTSVETVNVPDPALLSKLLRYDTNQDGILQVSEALSVTSLDVWNYGSYVAFSDPTGLEAFTNITQINMSNNYVTSFDASVYPQLTFLWCDANPLTSLDVHGLTNLKQINCDTGQLTSLDVSTCTNLEQLFVPRQQLTSLNISGLTGIKSLYCNNNHLTSLDVSLLTNMTNLCCSDNALTSLDLTGLEQIQTLCYGNQSIAAVDISHLPNLIGLYYGGGLSTTLDLNTAPNLQSFWAWNSNLTELDLSGLPLVNTVRLFSNPDLTYVNMKNGGHFLFSDDFVSYYTEFQSNPNLFYVCTNDVDQVAVNNKLSVVSNANGLAHAGTYCTFVPGGNYNTITGVIRSDANNNGCDALDVIQPNIKVNINDGTDSGSTFINTAGVYNFYTAIGSFDITPEIENPTWFNFSPTTVTIPFTDTNNNTTTQDFCITANGTHHDVEMVVSSITPARPGFEAKYKMVYKNKGNQTENVVLNFNYNEAVLDLVSTTTNPTASSSGTLQWSNINLLPFETGSIVISLDVNAPSATPPVNIGNILTFTSFIDVNPAVDEHPEDNNFTLHQTVVGSFDPNDITCLEGEIAAPSEIGNYLHYLARFENTGTFQAENVVVKVVVDTDKYDISTLQLLNTSHPCYTRVKDSIAEFIFQGINLAERLGNPPVGGHGDILFKIRTKNNLVVNDVVTKQASVFFDYNLPVNTNTAETVFATLSNTGFESDESIAVFPNPTAAIININASTNIKVVELYDIQGRILQTLMGNHKVLDITTQAKGIYFLKITTDKGSKVEKIVKQ
ncbi:T9SS type A sorting domain-containing protein [Flavobacterium sp.]|uniref:DUF7619 domain-containing protein n=1 Tax=Flavobacterium sp. TaxID=239 RepID=UPI00286D51B4|nr:T9SS type A sorting domain-containing protein [Flavobacterium sp.]